MGNFSKKQTYNDNYYEPLSQEQLKKALSQMEKSICKIKI